MRMITEIQVTITYWLVLSPRCFRIYSARITTEIAPDRI